MCEPRDTFTIPLNWEVLRGWLNKREREKKTKPDIKTLLFGLLVVLLSVPLAVVGLTLVRRLVPSTFFESHGEATDTIYQAIALVYGVTVDFAILLVWQQLGEAEATTQREASNVEALYRLAEQLPESDINRVQ